MKDYREVVAERYDQEQETASSIYAPTHPVGKYTREVLFGGVNDFIAWYRAQRGIIEDKRILDIGCGGGEMLAFFVDAGFPAEQATGIDLSETRIQRARQLLPEATFICTDGVHFDLLPAQFDLITVFDMLSHLPQKEVIIRSLTTMAQHLADDGLLLWYDINSKDHFDSPEHADSWGFSKQQMIDLAAEAGLGPVYQRSFFKLFLNRYHSAYQVRRFPRSLVKLLEKIVPGPRGNNLLVFRKRTA